MARFTVATVLVTAALQFAAAPRTQAQDYESHVVTIDASSPQPLGTGFIPPNANGEILILTEGTIRGFPSSRLDDGWFGPAGMTRMQRSGQPIVDGMPYGAVVGGFAAAVGNYRYVGRMGAFHLLPAHVGQEFRVTLNMSAADLAQMEGSVTVTVIFVADGAADIGQFVITDGTTLPLPTGMVAALGDRFLILPYGALQTDRPALLYSDGYFGPGGLPQFNHSGQPYSEGPYGGLYGYFIDAQTEFYIGDGGTWNVGLPGNGRELFLNLNLDPAQLVGADGRFVVNVIRIPQAPS